MVDWLAGLMETHPGVVNVLPVLGILSFGIFLVFFGFRRTFDFWPGPLGSVLNACFKTGCGVLIVFCLLGCVYFGMQSGIARQSVPLSPLLLGVLALAWLLIIVPCLFRDENKRRKKRPRIDSRQTGGP